VRRDGARAMLQLKSGTEAPVSRSYLKALKAEGWF
jgi:DNA-binding LytR/AlgR family response regulator